jgi:hypothetical protein
VPLSAASARIFATTSFNFLRSSGSEHAGRHFFAFFSSLPLFLAARNATKCPREPAQRIPNLKDLNHFRAEKPNLCPLENEWRKASPTQNRKSRRLREVSREAFSKSDRASQSPAKSFLPPVRSAATQGLFLDRFIFNEVRIHRIGRDGRPSLFKT